MHRNAFLARTGAVVALMLAGVAAPAFAHTGHETGIPFLAGALHPFSGADHIAAMVSVGLWAAAAGGRRVWAWPAAFVAAMLVGGILGRYGIAMPAVEPMIAGSVVVLGLMVAAGVSLPLFAGGALIALFAIAHGHAHGLEAPAAGWPAYAAGFAGSTALLHAIGIGAGLGIGHLSSRLPVRAIGLATASLGVVLMLRAV